MHEKLKKQLRQNRLGISRPPNAEEWRRFLQQIDEDYVNKSSGQHTRILHRKLDETMLLNRVIAATTSSYRTNVVLQIICEEFVEAFDLAQATAAFFNRKQTSLTIVAEHIREDGVPNTIGNKIAATHNPSIQHILQTKQPFVSTNVLEDHRLTKTQQFLLENGTGAMVLLPLISRKQIMGALGLNTNEAREFTEDELRLASSVAAAASQALDNAKLYEVLQRKLRDQERADQLLRQQYAYLGALQETILSLHNQLDLDILVQDIVQRATDLLNTNHGFLYLYDSQHDQFVLRAGCGAFEFSVGNKLVPNEGLGSATLESKQLVIVPDYHKRYGTAETESRLYGAAGIPLSSNHNILGILGFAHLTKDQIFNEQEVTILENFAQFATIVLDNVMLHAASAEPVQTENSTPPQIDQVESLQQIGRALQSPLQGMISHSESLISQAKSQAPPTAVRWQQELIALRDSGHSLVQRINDILELNDIESGKIDLQLRFVNIQSLINEAYLRIKPLLKQHNNTFTSQISPNLDMVYLDAGKVVRILVDILQNGAMFTRDGQIHLLAKQTTRNNVPYLMIEIEDTAQGISKTHLNHVLGTQNPLASAKARATQGDSFGLILSRYYCQLMGGDIEAKFSPNQGILFTIYLATTLTDDIDETIWGNKTIQIEQ